MQATLGMLDKSTDEAESGGDDKSKYADDKTKSSDERVKTPLVEGYDYEKEVKKRQTDRFKELLRDKVRFV